MTTFMSSFGELNYDELETSSSSSSSTSSSHEEVMILASARPKKRAGRRIFKDTRHPVYRGVRLRNKNKWVCEMRVPDNNKLRIWLGTHATPEMAARAHDVAALAFRGKSACLNFADSAWRLPLPSSTDAVEIRRTAMEAAQMFSVENKKQRQNINSLHISNVGVVDDDDDEIRMENSNELLLEEDDGIDMYVEQVFPSTVSSSEFENLLMSISDVPMMSPPPSPSPYTSYGYDVDIFDTQVSLWEF